MTVARPVELLPLTVLLLQLRVDLREADLVEQFLEPRVVAHAVPVFIEEELAQGALRAAGKFQSKN